MLVYLSIFDILNLTGKLANGIPSESSQSTELSNILICLIYCSRRSMWACTSSKIVVYTIKGGASSDWPCSMKGEACGIDSPGGGNGCIPYWLSGFWLRLSMTSWIEATVAVNWSTVAACGSISVWSMMQNNLSSTLTQDGKLKLRRRENPKKHGEMR